MSLFAQQARELAEAGRVGALCTLARDRQGWPFGSVAPYALDAAGRPVFLLSALAVHTQNLIADPRASLLIAGAGDADPLASPRLTLLGRVVRVPPEDLDAARDLYLGRHPQALTWADFGDFAFYRMEPDCVYFVGGFGVQVWVDDYPGQG
jgi:putative heme iron utilization protein